jgi:hypothetical protein
VHGRHRIALVELSCPWDTDAKRAEEHKTARYADLKIALSNEGCDCSLYLIEVGAPGHIIKSGIEKMMKDVSRISLVYLFAIFQFRNDPGWSFPHLVMRHIDGVPTGE